MNPPEHPSTAPAEAPRGPLASGLGAAPQENPEAQALRLIASIDEILAQETIWLRAGDCVKAAAASGRVAPLIARLGELAAAHPAAVATVGFRIGALFAGRRENLSTLNQLRVHLNAERARLAEARGRVQNIMPTYARRAPAAQRTSLNTAA